MAEALRRIKKPGRRWHLLAHGRGAFAPWLLSLFLALGPVYWLPGIDMRALQRFDWGILLMSLALVLGTELLKGRRPFPAGWLGPLGFGGILLLWLPGLVQASEPFQVVIFLFELGLCSAFFWCFYCIARDGGDVRAIFQRAFVIIVILAGIALLRTLLNTSDWQSSCQWDYAYITGFGIRHTIWSVGLAVFVPVGALFFLPKGSRRPLAWKFLGIIGIAVLIGSQFVSSGRSGILSSLLVLGALMLLPSFRRPAFAVVLIGLLASIAFLDDSCAKHLKLDRWAVTEPTSRAVNPDVWAKTPLDNLSTRRVQGYLLGLEKVAERPLLGHGLKQVRLDTPWGTQTEIHNLWLKWAVYTGIAAPLLLLFVVTLTLRAGWRIFRDQSRSPTEREEAALLGLILLSGLLISMLEIDIPIGVFQRTAIWWAAAGTLVGRQSFKSSPRDSRHPKRFHAPATE